MKPVVAIIGRPNVGKSTFFNAVTKTRDALVDDFPGVTRDRRYGAVSWDGNDFILVDTGGFTGKKDPFSEQVRQQILLAVDESDAVLLMMDGKTGVTPFDRDMVDLLRPLKKPVFYVVNKIDGVEQEEQAYEFHALGIEKLYSLSSAHRYGLSDFIDELVQSLPPSVREEDKESIHLAVVGRPNVGKSSLVNRILGQERLIVSDVPGTTRDAVDSAVMVDGRFYRLIDTAGIRRKGRVSKRIEKFSIIKALKSLERCDIALIVLDASQGVTDQDVTIAGYASERSCGCIFLFNKWDLVEKDRNSVRHYTRELRMASKFLNYAPVMTISALTGQRTHKLFSRVNEVYDQYTTRLSTGQVNRIVANAVTSTEPPLHGGRRLKFYYTTQIATKPPTFISFVNYPEAVHFSYKRYLINRIRESSGLDKTPIRLFFRPRSGRGKP
ncbi:MAG: ribosome biogenesis GTPase Der [Desulfobacterales bacterium]